MAVISKAAAFWHPFRSAVRAAEAAPAIWHVLRIYWLQDFAGMVFMVFHAAFLPMLIFYFASRIAGDQNSVLLRFLAGGVAAGAGIGVISLTGFGILADMQLGRLALFRAAGVPKWAYFMAHIASAALFSTISMFFSIVTLQSAGLIHVKLADLGPIVLVAIATGAAAGALGALVAVTAPSHTTGRDRLSMASTGLAFLSPVFYQASTLPAFLSILSWGSPFTHAAGLNRGILSGGPLPLSHLFAAFFLAAAFNAIAYRLLRW
jgi:ABC-type polysaccharide/polyol phosphate export permease